MSTWNRPISFYRLKFAWSCPRALQYSVDKVPPSDVGPNYYMQLGTWTQYTFELYFNQEVNLKLKGRSLRVIERVTEKVLASRKFQKEEISYPLGKTEDTLKEEIRRHVRLGFQTMDAKGLTRKKLRSEVRWRATFRGLRLYCQIDFLHEDGQRVDLYDGKGHAKEDADPRQLVFYALALAAAGRRPREAGLIYWQHGYRPVDVSPLAIRNFTEKDLDPALEWFNKLKEGTNETFPARPEPDRCWRCGWKSICESSPYRKPRRDDILELPGEVGFGELAPKKEKKR